MPSRISQMRNGQQQQLTQPQAQQPYQINEAYLDQLRTVLHSNNSWELLNNMAAQNPDINFLIQMARNGGNLRGMFETLAKQRGADPNWILKKLMG